MKTKLFRWAVVTVVIAGLIALYAWIGSTESWGSSHIPQTDHGIFSAMQDIESIENGLDYGDSIYEFMSTAWPDVIIDSQTHYGRHMNPTIHFDAGLETDSYGSANWLRHNGTLSFSMEYDGDTPVRQSVSFVMCCEYETFSPEVFISYADKYLGIELDADALVDAVSMLAIGSREIESDIFDITVSPCSYNNVEHVRLIVNFENAIVEGTETDLSDIFAG